VEASVLCERREDRDEKKGLHTHTHTGLMYARVTDKYMRMRERESNKCLARGNRAGQRKDEKTKIERVCNTHTNEN
jgi:hypothetical protein